ncbi:MAG TPA: hypothetical protein VEV41_17760 [Terriglobales bacterium]|nr:hypothetical protein [Terriglobales bacterium]
MSISSEEVLVLKSSAQIQGINRWYFNRDCQPLNCGSGVLSVSSKKFHGTF